MIACISGKLIFKTAQEIIVDVNGVGYRLLIPLGTFYEIPETGSSVSLKVYTHVKEDAIQLFGFKTGEEKEIFRTLISVSGIGPRLAINLLSGISAPDLVRAICTKDLARLVSIPGIGRKTAERIIFELQDKITGTDTGKPALENTTEGLKKDALSALVNLGYKMSAAQKAVDDILASPAGEITLETLLKKALSRLSY